MNILIYGANGWIGNQVTEYLNISNINYTKGKSRVDNLDELKKEINDIKPTHIISLIGRTHGIIDNKIYTTIDYLENPGKLKDNIRDNLYSPLVLAILCKQENIHFTYLGTGCIFEYDDDHTDKNNNGFNEDDLPNFFGSSYSIVKGFTDRLMHMYDILNLRIRMPINSEYNERNFITKITNYNKICSIQNSMSVLPELIPIAIDLMKKKYIGTINLTNPGSISHNEILQMYKEIVDPDFEWENFSIDEQNKILKSKRSNNYLNTNKLQTLYPNVKNIKDSIYDCLKKYDMNNHLPLKNCKKISILQQLKLEHEFKQKRNYTCDKTIKDEINIMKNYNFPNNKISINNKTILVTGGYGFIASHFINYIFEKYDKLRIINVDAMYYCANENNVNEYIRLSNRYTFIKENICVKKSMDDILKKYNVNFVINFAAQSHVQNSFEDSIQYTKDNILGTHTLLESCRNYGLIEKFIHVSTDEVYGESIISIDETQKTEYSTLCPTNPYAGTKAGAELIAQTYAHSFKMPIIITRGNNVYGSNQYPEKLIPKFIQLLHNNKKVTIQGDGSAIRSFIHVFDTITAFDIILNRGSIGEIYNIGCDEDMEYSVLDIAKILIKLIKNTNNFLEWIEFIDDRPFNDARYYISNEKLKKLGWNITIKFEDGIKTII